MGMGPIGQHHAEQRRQQAELLRLQQQQALNDAAGQPIPGVAGQTTPPGGRVPGVLGSGPPPDGSPPTSGWRPNMDSSRSMMAGLVSRWMNETMTPEQWASMAPPSPATAQPHAMQPGQMGAGPGPYAQQALGMAGLLGQQSQTPPIQYGLLGSHKGPRGPGGK